MMATARPRVVIAGGGIAALEALLALRAVAEDRAEIAVLAPNAELVHRPMIVAEPFGLGEAVHYGIDPLCATNGASRIPAALASVNADDRIVTASDGAHHDYDVLLVATGAREAVALPGAITFGGPDAVTLYRSVLEDIVRRNARRIAFVVPQTDGWTLPLYELALLTETWARTRGHDVELLLVTAEERPLQAFGPDVSDAVTLLLAERGIALRESSFAESVADGRVWLPLEGSFHVDHAIALPRPVGRALPGLTQDEHGFLPVDEQMAVRGTDFVYAAGDATDHPVKQGGIAAEQADVAATSIAAALDNRAAPRQSAPILRGMLLTGDAPLYLEAPSARNPGGLVTDEALWWPAGKLFGRHLSPELARMPARRRTG